MIISENNNMNYITEQDNYILNMYLNEELSEDDILDLYEYGYISEDILEYIEENKLTRGLRTIGHYSSLIADPNHLIAAYHAGQGIILNKKIKKTKDPVERMYLQKQADKHAYKLGRHFNNMDNKAIKYHLKQHLDARRSADKDVSEKHKLKAKALLNMKRQYSGLNNNELKNKVINDVHRDLNKVINKNY